MARLLATASCTEPIIEVASDAPKIICHTAEPLATTGALPRIAIDALMKNYPCNLDCDSIIMLARFKGEVRDCKSNLQCGHQCEC